MKTRKTKQIGGTTTPDVAQPQQSAFTFGVAQPQQASQQSPFTFGVTNAKIIDYKHNEWAITRSTKDLNNFLKLNNEKPYDFRDFFSFTDVEGIQLAKSQENQDVFLFRGNPVFCDKLDFELYSNKPIWLSNFKVAAEYAGTSGSVIGYRVAKQLSLFVLSNINNIRELLKFYKDKEEDLNVIKLATGVDLEPEEHKRLFQEKFKGMLKWNEPQNGQKPTIRRAGITSTDTKLLEKIREYCENKGIYIDGYYSDQVFTPQSALPFHEEICLFAPKDRVQEDRTKSKCTFAFTQNSERWGGKITQQSKVKTYKSR